MQALSLPSRTVKHPFRSARIAMMGTLSRILWSGRPSTATPELRDDSAMLWDARGSMRCGNPARSWRVLSEWLRSRGDQPED
jgi:hypothetical protein